MNRVVITGLGVISPVGCNAGEFWSNLCQGRCGITKLDRFDTQDFKVKVAAQVQAFRPGDYGMDVPTARRMDRYTQYAMAAAREAVADSGIQGQVEPERLGAAASAAWKPLSMKRKSCWSGAPAGYRPFLSL